jgi:hypothetical protein
MVRIAHEAGTFECTANHRVWTYEDGYIEAGKLTQRHTLKNLSNLQKGIRLQPARQGGTEATALFSNMPKEWCSQNRNKALRTVWKGIHFQINRQKKQRQEKILWNILRCNMANGTTQAKSFNETIHASYVVSISGSDKGQAQSCSLSADEGKQSNCEPRMEKENVTANVWSDISSKRWQWNINSPTTSGSKRAEPAYGVCNTDGASEESIQISSELLQGRCCRPTEKTSNRDRWADPQHEEMEIPGQTEDGGVERSRVVSVTFLESASGFRSGSSTQGNKRVYCLEVAGTHNFFAEGVLVSNCYKNLYFHTKMTRIAGLPNTDSQRAFDMFVKRARRVFTRKPLPSGVISGIMTASANICAHESK